MGVLHFVFYTFGVWSILFGIYYIFSRAESAFRLLVKIAASAFLIWVGIDLGSGGGIGALIAVLPLSLLAPLWARPIGEFFGRLVGKGFDGGNREVEKKALLSAVEGYRAAGDPQNALISAEQQIEQFPEDFDCHLLVARIQAEDLRDVGLATRMVKSILRRPKTDGKQIAHALTTLAEWQLNISRNPDLAAITLRQIIRKFPDSRAAHSADQRIANMPTRSKLEEQDRPKESKVMPEFERDLGLKGKTGPVVREVDFDTITEQYLVQLKQYPNDWDTREKLAHHYIEHYEGTEHAIQQMEKLIASKFSKKAEKCRWLHQIANWQYKVDVDPAAARETLDRVSEMYPGTSYADQADRAKQYLRG
jgi:tetratricopeptide (TPR) repeat protein